MQNFIVISTFSILDLFLQVLFQNQFYLDVAWLISQKFSRRDLKPVAVLVKKENPTEVFPCELFRNFKSSFFHRTYEVAASMQGIVKLTTNFKKLHLDSLRLGLCYKKIHILTANSSAITKPALDNKSKYCKNKQEQLLRDILKNSNSWNFSKIYV